jgi:hypothetical protein
MTLFKHNVSNPKRFSWFSWDWDLNEARSSKSIPSTRPCSKYFSIIKLLTVEVTIERVESRIKNELNKPNKQQTRSHLTMTNDKT